MFEQTVLQINDTNSIMHIRQTARDLAKLLDFGSADQTRLATAVSELVRNVLQHGGGEGTCQIENQSDSYQDKICIIVEDEGPGIIDIDMAMQDGYSTQDSLGAGLPGTKRLVQEFMLTSEPGRTSVTIALSRRRQ